MMYIIINYQNPLKSRHTYSANIDMKLLVRGLAQRFVLQLHNATTVVWLFIFIITVIFFQTSFCLNHRFPFYTPKHFKEGKTTEYATVGEFSNEFYLPNHFNKRFKVSCWWSLDFVLLVLLGVQERGERDFEHFYLDSNSIKLLFPQIIKRN